MIQSVLYFALGFLAAILLGLLVAPPIWRRAMVLTRKRVEAETPLTLNEIQAQRDGLRAEHAMAERKLELTLERLKDKAGRHLAERSEKERLAATLAGDLAEREKSIAELQSLLAARDQDLEKASAANGGRERLLDQRASELELLHRRLASVATDADSLKIEAAAQSARIDNLSADLKTARQDKRDSDEQRHKAEADLAELRHAMEQEVERRAEPETQSSDLLRQLTESEAKLARREKEVTRINERLRKVLADGRRQAPGSDMPRGKQALVQSHENELLRETMNALSAQVVAMVARLEGPGSAIDALLAGRSEDAPAVRAADGKIILSLADRIRALQAASEPGEAAEPR